MLLQLPHMLVRLLPKEKHVVCFLNDLDGVLVRVNIEPFHF